MMAMGHVARDVDETLSCDCLGSREAREKWHVNDAPEGRETAVAAAGFLARFVCHFIHDSADHVPSIYLAPSRSPSASSFLSFQGRIVIRLSRRAVVPDTVPLTPSPERYFIVIIYRISLVNRERKRENTWPKIVMQCIII